MNKHDEWYKNPTGKIEKGVICGKCARFNARDVVCHALVVRKGKVLMILRDNKPMAGYWGVVGGYLGWDEKAEECAIRELKEEVGLVGENPKLLGVYSDPKRDKDGRQNLGVAYVVEAEGTPKALDEVKKVKWFEFDKLPEKIAFDHRRMISDYIRNQ